MIDWGHWFNEPLFLAVLLSAGWAYALAIGPLRHRLAPGSAFPRRQAAYFGMGVVIAYLAVGAPWERAGRYYLFSVEVMLQMLLVYPAAGFMLAGIPGWMADAALELPILRWIGRRALGPVVCGLLFITGVSACYSPFLHEPAIRSEARLAGEHLVYWAAGLFFWWPIANPSTRLPRLRYAGRMVYLFAAEVALTGAFTYLLMAEHPIYPTYALAPRVIAALTPEDDQLMGGVMLSAISSLVMVGALGAAFYGWFKDSEKATTGRGKNIPARP
jgi:putative membrane protein